MFRAVLLLIMKRYYCFYAAVCIRHAFMLTGCWQDPFQPCQQPVNIKICLIPQTKLAPVYNSFTHSMVQSPYWEANCFAASPEIPRILCNPNVHSRTHKRPPPVSVLGQPNPVHIPTPHLLEIHPNIIHPSTPRSPQWFLSLRFPHIQHPKKLLITQ